MTEIDFISVKREAIHHNYLALVSLTIVLWEWLLSLQDEVKYIWRCPSRKTRVAYCFARYFAIIYLSINIILTYIWTSRLPVSKDVCFGWYIQHTSAFAAQYAASHYTLLRRVYLLQKKRDVFYTLGAFHFAEIVGCVYSSQGTVSAMTFDSTCHALTVPKDVFLFLGLFIFGQVLIWSMIVRGTIESDLSGSPVSPPLDFRAKLYRVWYDGDGKLLWVICFFCLLCNTVYSYASQRVEPLYIFFWPTSLLSIATCRYTLSMEKASYIRSRFLSQTKGKERAVQAQEDTEDGIQVTTTINLDDNQLDERSRRSSLSTYTEDWIHPIGLQSIITLDSSTISDESNKIPEIILTTSPTNSIMSYERRRSRTASEGSRRSVQTNITAPTRGSGTPRNSDDGSADIEIGSMHRSSSMDSEELRDFWNATWNGNSAHGAGAFIA